jgi:hypothetical protein
MPAGAPTRWTAQPFTLASLSDVAATAPAAGQILTWQSPSWVPTNYNINTIGGVTIATPAINNVLRLNSAGVWTNQAIALTSLSDTAIPSTAAGDVITRNAGNTAWISQQPTGGGGGSITLPTTLTNSAQPYGLQIKQAPFSGAGNWFLQIGGGQPSGMTAGNSNGIFCAAGTSSSDVCLWFTDDASANTYAQILGDGSAGYFGKRMGDASMPGFRWGATGWSLGNLTGGDSIVSHAPASGFAINGSGTTLLNWDGSTLTVTAGHPAAPEIEIDVDGSIYIAAPQAAMGGLQLTGPGNSYMSFNNDGTGSLGAASYFSWGAGATNTTGSWQLSGPSANMYVQPATAPTTPATFNLYLVGTIGGALNGTPTVATILCNHENTANIATTNGIGSVQFPNITTTATAANAYIDNTHNNNLLRSTSARRFKTDIRNLGPTRAWEILSNLNPVLYRSLCAADDPDRQHIGLIAEEVAEVCPELVTYDAEGRPANVQYERLAVLLLAAQG